MGYYLRQNTATVITIGPLIDDTDLKTREAEVAYNQAGVDCAIMKNNGTLTAVTITNVPGVNCWVNKGKGIYTLELTVAQTNTIGSLVVSYSATGVLPWFDTFYVVAQNTFDSLLMGSAYIRANTLSIASNSISATLLSSFISNGIDHDAVKIIGVKTTDSVTAISDKTGYALSEEGVSAVQSGLASAPGSSTIPYTYTLSRSDNDNPIEGASVHVTSDAAGNNLVANGTTNANGQVVFYLTAGTYYFWRQKAGYHFVNPDQEVV